MGTCEGEEDVNRQSALIGANILEQERPMNTGLERTWQSANREPAGSPQPRDAIHRLRAGDDNVDEWEYWGHGVTVWPEAKRYNGLGGFMIF